MAWKCLSAALLCALFAPVAVDAGLAVVCDQFKITSIVFTSLQCTQTPMTGLNLGSDLGGTVANNDPYYANCNSPYEISSFSVSFTTTTTLSQGGTNYSGRRVILYNPNRSQHSTTTLPTASVFSYATTPDPLSFYINMIHDYTHLGTPGTCQTSKRFSVEQELNLVECRKFNLTAIELPGLECDMELTGLTIPFGGSYAPSTPFANCILPVTANSTSARFQYASLAGALGVQYTQTDFFSNNGLYAGAVPPAFSTVTFTSANRPTSVVVNPLVQTPQPDSTRENNCRCKYNFNFALPFPTPVCPGLSQANCYLNRRGCHWSGSTCLQGAPSTCAQYLTDSVGCTANSNCTVWTNNGNLCTDACDKITPQLCVGSTPVRTHCRLDFNTQTCSAAVGTDLCLSKPSQATCNSTTCLWDPHVSNCFYNLTQANTVFSCTYWNSISSVDDCVYHGCVLLNNNQCGGSISTSNTADNSSTINFAQKIQYLSPAFIPASESIRVSVSVPFATNSRPNKIWPLSPPWPNIVVSDPLLNIGAIMSSINTNCSMQSRSVGPPVELTSSAFTAAELQNYIIPWVKANKTLTFDPNSAIGRAASAIYGNPRMGANDLVTQVAISFDTSLLQFTFQAELPALVQNCAHYGVSLELTPTARIYTVPLAYVEQSPDGLFSQYTQNLKLTVLLAGGSSLVTSTNYRQVAFPVEILFPRNVCPAGAAAMQIVWQLELRDRYDSLREIGPRSIADIVLRSPDSPLGPTNCYGDTVIAFQKVGCNPLVYSCIYTITTRSACRTLTEDGQAFNECKYANSSDRISDLGGNFNYSTSLNAVHRFFVYNWNCPLTRVNDLLCVLSVKSTSGYPDEVYGSVQASQYDTLSRSENPFIVSAGFLPTPTAPLANITLIGANQTQQYDGNLYTDQALTIVIVLPELIRNVYSLRFANKTTQLRITAVDLNGVEFMTSTNRSSITFSDIQNQLLYTPHNAFLSPQCSPSRQCRLLPACANQIGCDGLSFPVQALRTLLPSKAYSFAIEYELSLQRTAGAARRLLQTQSGTLSTGGGHLFFVLNLDPETSTINAEVCNYDEARAAWLVEMTLADEQQRALVRRIVLDWLVPLVLFQVLLFALISSAVFNSNKA